MMRDRSVTITEREFDLTACCRTLRGRNDPLEVVPAWWIDWRLKYAWFCCMSCRQFEDASAFMDLGRRFATVA